jgi:hypothetical protein
MKRGVLFAAAGLALAGPVAMVAWWWIPGRESGRGDRALAPSAPAPPSSAPGMGDAEAARRTPSLAAAPPGLPGQGAARVELSSEDRRYGESDSRYKDRIKTVNELKTFFRETSPTAEQREAVLMALADAQQNAAAWFDKDYEYALDDAMGRSDLSAEEHGRSMMAFMHSISDTLRVQIQEVLPDTWRQFWVCCWSMAHPDIYGLVRPLEIPGARDPVWIRRGRVAMGDGDP